MATEPIGRMLMYIGIVLVLVGAFFILLAKVSWLGRLPGDFVYRGGRLTVFIPVTSMILISLVLTILMNIFWRR
jgi:hypothetical protein